MKRWYPDKKSKYAAVMPVSADQILGTCKYSPTIVELTRLSVPYRLTGKKDLYCGGHYLHSLFTQLCWCVLGLKRSGQAREELGSFEADRRYIAEARLKHIPPRKMP